MRLSFAVLALCCVCCYAFPSSNQTYRDWGLSSRGFGAQGKSGCDTSDESFDYLLLVQQWPAAQGAASWPSGAVIDDFTLHGLWPSRIGADVNSYPCTCTEEQFSEDKVSSSLDEMKQHWPSYTGQDDTFWGHEWSKHGTCCDKTSGLEDQESFFSSALGMRDKAGLLAALTKANIKPDGSSYAYSDMANAIKSAIGVAPLLGCKTGNTLSEIGLCYSSSSKSLQECDESVKNQQGDEVSDCATDVKVVFAKPGGPSPAPSPGDGKCADYGCGKFLPGKPCQCNTACKQYDNCCPDYDTVCSGPTPPGPPTPPTPPTPPSPPSPPSGNKCVKGAHGPACSSDADCTPITDCVRCASSGYCTCADKSTGQCAPSPAPVPWASFLATADNSVPEAVTM